MEDFRQQIAQRIKAARKDKGKTQAEVAQTTGMDQSYISRLENATAEGTPSQLMAIARAIGVPVARFYGEQDDRAVKLSGLSDEAINVASKWDDLEPEQQQAIMVIVEALDRV